MIFVSGKNFNLKHPITNFRNHFWTKFLRIVKMKFSNKEVKYISGILSAYSLYQDHLKDLLKMQGKMQKIEPTPKLLHLFGGGGD